MSDMTRLVTWTDAEEATKAVPYLDTENLWTVATGRCLETNPFNAAEWKYLLDNKLIALNVTPAGSEWLLRKELAAIEHQLSIDYTLFWQFLNDARQNALIEWAYQLGVAKEEAFHVAIQAIREARWDDAERAMLDSLWAKQTPARAKRVAEQLRTGEFP